MCSAVWDFHQGRAALTTQPSTRPKAPTRDVRRPWQQPTHSGKFVPMTDIEPPSTRPLPRVAYSSVLACTDGLHGITPALQVARHLATALALPLHVVHAQLGRSPSAQEQRTHAEQQATGLGARFQTIQATEGVLWDVANPLLQACVADSGALPVLATNRSSLAARALLGSVSSAVVRGLRRPVALLGPDTRPPSTTYRRVVALTDGSELSEAAFPIAVGLAQDLCVPLWLITVAGRQRGEVPRLRNLASDLATIGVVVHWETLEGPTPAEVIIDYASRSADTVTVGATHGHSAVRELVLGSTIAEVVRHAVGPVVTIRPFHSST